MEERPAFGAVLRQLRVRRGLSLAELARLVHYSKSYLSRIETGERVATEELARQCDEVLDGDGELVRCLAPPVAAPRRPGTPPAQLPPMVSGFVGRSSELSWLDGCRAGEAQIALICGPPGVGKTALATRWAHAVAREFPDGALFADLGGYGPGSPSTPDDVLAAFLDALDVRSKAVPESLAARTALFRTLLAGRRILVVLDNAASAAQLRPLLPASTGCFVLVTSRGRLSSLVAREGAARRVVQPLPATEAVSLLAGIVGAGRVAAESHEARAIAECCGRLPLALRIGAERAAARPHLSLAALAGELRVETQRLDLLAVGEDDSTAVRAVLSWSYSALPPGAARAFRLIGLAGLTELGEPAVAALCGGPTGTALGELCAVHLLEETGAGSYRLHDLLRVYAAELARAQDGTGQREQALYRLRTWYLYTAAAADHRLAPQRLRATLAGAPEHCEPLAFGTAEQAIRWLDAEYTNLLAVAAQAAQADDPVSWQLPAALWGLFHMRQRWADLIACCERGLAAARRRGDERGEAWMLNNLGDACRELGRHEAARAHLEQARAIVPTLDDGYLRASVLNNLAGVAVELSRLAEGLRLSWQALEAFRQIGDRRGEAILHNNLGEVYRLHGQPHRSLEHLGHALTIFSDTGNRYGEGFALTNLGLTHRTLGQHDQAVDVLRRAVKLRREIGDRRGEAASLRHLAGVLDDVGQAEDASDARRQARSISEELGDAPRGAPEPSR